MALDLNGIFGGLGGGSGGSGGFGPSSSASSSIVFGDLKGSGGSVWIIAGAVALLALILLLNK